jgi:predicted O-methyltransferase YrrM
MAALALVACDAERSDADAPERGQPRAREHVTPPREAGEGPGVRASDADAPGAVHPLLSLPVTGPVLAQKGQKVDPYRTRYEFTRDAFTFNLPVWEKALAPYRGREGLRYLEVGLFEGRSALWMLENVLTHPSSTLVGIDPFGDPYGVENVEGRFYANLEKSGRKNQVTVIKGYSGPELRKLPPESFDIIYVDGSHAAPDVLEDAVLCMRLLKTGGLLIFDDYKWNLGAPLIDRPEAALNAFMYFYGPRFEVVHADYQVFLRRRAEEAR